MDASTYPHPPAVPLSPRPLPDLLADAVARFGDRPAIDFLGRRYDWTGIGALAGRAAAGLQALGVAKGVHVGLCLPNTPYSVILYFAVLKAGGTVVNFNPLYTEREMETQAREADVGIIVSIDLALIHGKIAALAAKGVFRHVVVCSLAAALPPLKGLGYRLLKRRELARVPDRAPFVRYETLIRPGQPFRPVAIDPDRDVACLQFTGGTTGVPKAAMLSHGNISMNVAQVLVAGPDLRDGDERFLCILPLFHVFAMTAVMMVGIAVGAELILLPRLDIKQLMKTIASRRPTFLPGVPTLFTAVTNAAQAKGGMDLTFIRHCVSGGAPIAAETAERFGKITGCEVLEGYGLSETSPVVTATKPGEVRLGSVGRCAAETVVTIRDPEDAARVLPQGERGEICVSGPQVMLGYYNRPEETAKAFAGGTFHTGDVGYVDADGYLFIVDRIKDLILCGGYNVYPRVIEEAAYLHPAVHEAVAIGVPDPYRGQSPKLFVTLRPGATATPDELKSFLAEHLNKIELPKEVELRDSLPKTMVGKLSRKELVAEEVAKHAG